MIILDTNVVSEPYRPTPSARVRAWLDSQPTKSLFLCSPVLAALQFGVERLPSGAQRTRLTAAIDELENDLYRDRILSFDTSAAKEFGRIMAERERIGRRIELMDAQIAAIALTHRAALATRDTSDFANLGLQVVNPFEAVADR
jgi:predicted nucleic acid-binding protein